MTTTRTTTTRTFKAGAHTVTLDLVRDPGLLGLFVTGETKRGTKVYSNANGDYKGATSLVLWTTKGDTLNSKGSPIAIFVEADDTVTVADTANVVHALARRLNRTPLSLEAEFKMTAAEVEMLATFYADGNSVRQARMLVEALRG